MTLNTAILFYGVVHRSLPHTVQSIRQYLIEPLQQAGRVDLFFHSWANREVHNPRGGETHVEIDPAEIERLLPEAKGLCEDTADWRERLTPDLSFESNPFGHMTLDQDAARNSLQNYMLALESLRRVHDHFLATKSGGYDMVLICRPDVKFLNALPVRPHKIHRELLYTPMFHRYQGCNDRFALGSEHSAEVYCRRYESAFQALSDGNFPINTEQFLHRHLGQQRIKTALMDLVFQRIRADGSAFPLDQVLHN